MNVITRCLAGFVLILMLPGPSQAVAQPQAKDDSALAGRLYVQFDDAGVSPAGGRIGIEAFDRKASQYSVTVIEKAFPSLDVIAQHRPLSAAAEALRRVYVVSYTSPAAPQVVARDLEAVAGVGYAEPIHRKEIFGRVHEDRRGRMLDPDDPLFSQQTHLRRLELPDAWDTVQGSNGDALIGVVDGGTDWRHEDLEANVWTNPNEVAGNGVDDDNNGFVDDIHGWNFSTDSADPTGPSGSDTGWHGTAVAGTATAVTDNSTGIAGAAWNAKFMALNVSCSDQQYLCHTHRGMLYAGMNGADAVTASFGSSSASATGELLVQAVTEAGALIVAASGNDGIDGDVSPQYPAGYPLTLSVGGTLKDSDLNVFNYGQTVNVYAPGVNIDATEPSNRYTYASGTSFSAPLTAGVAALVKTEFPHFDAHRVREQIRLTAVSIDGANAPQLRGKFGRGRVDAEAAVTAAPLPAIRVKSWTYQNQDGNQQVKAGDAVDVTVRFINYHADGSGLSAELTAAANYLTWNTQTVSLGSMANGDSTDVTFQFTVNTNAPSNQRLRMVPLISGTGFTDKPDLLRMTVNETGVEAHATSKLSISVTAEGNIGHTSFQGLPNNRGIGFVPTFADGSSRDVLFEGGLLVATSSAKVSDCVRQTETNLDEQQEDFTVKTGEALEIRPGQYTTEEGRVVLVDSPASSPIGIEVLQESYIDDTAGHEDFAVLSYTITNVSGSRIENLHVGLFFDWDVASNASDVTGFDAGRGVGYLMDRASNPNVVVGTRLLTDDSLHYSAIDNPATIYRGQGNDGFTPTEKWDLLSGGVQNNGVITGGPRDVSQLTATGPFTLEAMTSVEVAFAVIAGTSVSDFQTNADAAQALWDNTITSTEDDVRPTAGWAVHAPYPNPAVFPMELRFELAAHSGVQLDIYDVLGRRVRRVLDAQRPGGEHVVAWDGRDEVGRQVASGMYLVRMRAQNGDRLHVNSKPIVVVR